MPSHTISNAIGNWASTEEEEAEKVKYIDRAQIPQEDFNPTGDHSIRPHQPDRASSGSRILQPGRATTRKRPRDSGHPSLRNQTPESEEDRNDNEHIDMLRQPETRSISHEQLVIEVKGIYAGLVMVEGKCIDVDEKQSHVAQETSRKEPLKNDQWQSSIALHKQLLHEHHDFFLASQHPAASSNLSKLAAKYSMPARMWRHGIHAFLEVLRHRLPESLEHMLAFIYIAYSMMALLFETVPTFEDTWIECLGDLGRYRMAIEDDEPKDREVWSGVARFWYSKASSKNPTVGRLYHHLAILANPFTLEQLSFYTRSLTCVTPFESARGSILTLFNPILNGRDTSYYRFSSIEPMIIKLHGLIFLYPKTPVDEINQAMASLKANDGAVIFEAIDKFGIRFKRLGVSLAVANIAALLEFGALTSKGTQRAAFRLGYDGKYNVNPSTRPLSSEGQTPISKTEVTAFEPSTSLTVEEIKISKVVRSYAAEISFFTFKIALAKPHWTRNHTLPMILVYFIFICSASSIPSVIETLEDEIPWAAMCTYLNHLKIDSSLKQKIWDSDFPSPTGISDRPPPELYIVQGQVYTQYFLPNSLYEDAKVDDEERMLDVPSHDPYRILTVLWLAVRIASLNRWIKYDKETKKFIVLHTPKTDLTDADTQTFKFSLKFESPDDDLQMEDIPTTVTKNADVMSDVIVENKPIKGETMMSDAKNEILFTNITETSTVHLEMPLTPRAGEIGADESEEPPMKDISPGKEHMSPIFQVEGTSWDPGFVFELGRHPRKDSGEQGSDRSFPRIAQDHEAPEGDDP